MALVTQPLRDEHRELLPERPDLGAEGFLARISPYQVTVPAGETISFAIEIRNPFPRSEEAVLRVVAPQGWEVEPAEQRLQIEGVQQLTFTVTPTGPAVRRARVAVDVTIASQRFGQQAEALVTLLDRDST